jgi:protein SCO1/2
MIKTALALLAFSSAAVAGQSPLPFDLGGEFVLTDQSGSQRTQKDPNDRYQLLFFGYANCQQICSAALPLMGDIAREMSDRGIDLQPIMITVDPARDTVEKIGAPLVQHHDQFLGLTGSEDELQIAYDAYSVEKEEIFFDPEFGPVFAHGSFIYLLDRNGKFLTLFPPIVSPEAGADIVSDYVGDTQS